MAITLTGVSTPTTSNSTLSGKSTHVAAIAGGVAGGVVALIAVAILIYWYRQRQRQRQLEDYMDSQPDPMIQPLGVNGASQHVVTPGLYGRPLDLYGQASPGAYPSGYDDPRPPSDEWYNPSAGSAGPGAGAGAGSGVDVTVGYVEPPTRPQLQHLRSQQPLSEAGATIGAGFPDPETSPTGATHGLRNLPGSEARHVGIGQGFSEAPSPDSQPPNLPRVMHLQPRGGDRQSTEPSVPSIPEKSWSAGGVNLSGHGSPIQPGFSVPMSVMRIGRDAGVEGGREV